MNNELLVATLAPQASILEVIALGLLALIAVGLFWQAFREWRTGQNVNKRIEQMAKRSWTAEREGALNLLRQTDQGGVGWGSIMEDLQVLFEQAGLDWKPRPFALRFLSLVGLLGLMGYAWQGMATALMLVVLLVAGMGLWLKYQQRKRQQAFERHFPEALELLARSLKAGHAFTAGLQAVGEEATWPVNEEFQQVFEEQKFGLPLREALMGLNDRNNLMDVKLFVTSVLIQRDTGGNLVELLEGLVDTIRERFSFRRELKTHTAHGRITGLIVVVAPVIVAAGLYLIHPDYLSLLWTEPLGRVLLMGAIGLEILGFLWMRRIVDIQL